MRTETRKTRGSAKAKQVSSQRTSTPKYSHPVLDLQQKIGNQAVRRIVQLRRIQAKLTIGAPNDIYEQEADRVADQIMRMPDHGISENGESSELGAAKIRRLYQDCQPKLLRQPTEEIEEEEERLLQAKEISDRSADVSKIPEGPINSLCGGGQPLSSSVRQFMEPRFGQNFDQVRIHTNPQAEKLARSINARAFTLGQDVVFAAGQYAPASNQGKRLLAHELTHVLQQCNTRIDESIQRLVDGDVTRISITPAWAYDLTDQELQDQITILRGQLDAIDASDPDRTILLSNHQVLEQEVLDRMVPTGPTTDRFLNEWLGLHTAQHLSSDRSWIAGQWPVGGSLATLNAAFRAGVQALLNFAAATPNLQFSIISYARSAPKQHVMHVGQYIRKGWMGYSKYKLSKWPDVTSAGGRAAILALPTHRRRSTLRGITNPDLLDVVWDTGTSATSKTHGTKIAEMYHIGINNPVANSGAAYVWPTGKTTTSRHGSGNAVDADPVQVPNVVTIRQNQAHTWPTLAALQGEMGAANVQVVAATPDLPAGYRLSGLSNIGRRDAFFHLFFQVRSAARAGFVDPAHFQAP